MAVPAEWAALVESVHLDSMERRAPTVRMAVRVVVVAEAVRVVERSR